nr:putative reverse transcriptase domain-containing protein [Tanacetum cinerariifolium]
MEVTPPLRVKSSRVHRQRERIVGFKEVSNREKSKTRRNTEGNRPSEAGAEENGRREINLPTLLSAHLGRNKNGQPLQSSLTSVHRGHLSSINDYPLLDKLKMPSQVVSYDGKRDPDNFLFLFKGAIRIQKWLKLVAYHMFTYNLKDSARIWWNSQKA